MSNEDFNAFLESIGGLENGYFTDRPPIISRYWCSCDNGWLGLIKQLIEDCIKAGWNKQSTQIKEKYGGLRFYINGATDEVWNLISKAEEESYHICEICGSTQQVGSTQEGWVYTRCKKCAEKEELIGWKENRKGNEGIITLDIKYPSTTE